MEEKKRVWAKPPSKVKVGYSIYDVSVVPFIQREKGKPESAGVCNRLLKKIEIRKDHAHSQVAPEIILHEILHAVWSEFQLDPRKEEEYITTLGVGLTNVFKDNPKLLKYLEKSLHGP